MGVSSGRTKGSWLGNKGTSHSVDSGNVGGGSTGQGCNLSVALFTRSSLSAGDLPAVDHLDNLLHLRVGSDELNSSGAASGCILSEGLVLWTDLTRNEVSIGDKALSEELLDERIGFTLGIDTE